MIIRRAQPEDAKTLSLLSMRSKAHWGYNDAFMRACEEELSDSPEDVADKERHYGVAEIDNKVVGFYRLEDTSQPKMSLLSLFIEPEIMGKGVGKSLFEDACDAAQSMGANSIDIQSDPYAETFYQKMGAKTVGKLESGSIEGRFLPLMTFEID